MGGITTGRNTQFLSGVAELTRQLAALQSLEDGKALKRCVKSGINEALKRAREIIPQEGIHGHKGLVHRLKTSKLLHDKYGAIGALVTPGFAKRSLRTISTINAEKNVAAGLLSVRKAAYYAVQFLEFGTRKMPAQPWLRRSLIEARDRAEAALRHSLEVSVDKAARTR
jgi:HK97 gp10 family phage protein